MTRKKAIGFAGGSTGRRDSCVRRVDDYRGAYGTVGHVEKPGDEPGLRFPLRPLYSANKTSRPRTFPQLVHLIS
jgi:hypothetical protein